LSELDRLYAIPEIDFVQKDIETILAEMLKEYQDVYFAANGKTKTLAPGDPVRIWIQAQALKQYTAYQLIDWSAKQNLLKYSSGDILENIGARIGVTRNPAQSALSTVRFVLSAVQISVIGIPKGTRVSPGNDVFFETQEYAEISIGQTSVDVNVSCAQAGVIGNGFTSGQINTLVDPIAYIELVSNTETSQGGTDIESDDSLRERIFLRPDAFSVAGPEGAYVYFVKAYNQSIIDVSVTSPTPGEVDIRFILTGGALPDTTLAEEVLNYISDSTRRPLTDHVSAAAPEVVNYNVTVSYYIKKSDTLAAESIQAAVNKAIDDYIIWQKSKIGRDINPDELISRIKSAGAKRVELTAPTYTALTNIQIGISGTKAVTYGGLEDE
jgi:phage-related baseplate assembly protein